jgi:hypothetical protein
VRYLCPQQKAHLEALTGGQADQGSSAAPGPGPAQPARPSELALSQALDAGELRGGQLARSALSSFAINSSCQIGSQEYGSGQSDTSGQLEGRYLEGCLDTS